MEDKSFEFALVTFFEVIRRDDAKDMAHLHSKLTGFMIALIYCDYEKYEEICTVRSIVDYHIDKALKNQTFDNIC